MTDKLTITRSNELYERAIRVIPGGTQTLSKGPDRFPNGAFPKFISHGKGSHVWDEDGNEYVDYPCGLGAIVLGYGIKDLDDAVNDTGSLGTVFTLPTELEIDLAEKLVSLIPSAEKVRLAKNGSDATSGAVRISRAFTGKDHVARCGYHGWHDWAAIDGGLKRGIPAVMADLQTAFTWNDPDSLEAILKRGDCGTVILEVPLEEPENDFLQHVKELAHHYGALFIMDEVVTGFRYHMGGAQVYYDVVPDITCVGKAMGNGYPISAIVGRADVMDVLTDGCFFSGTFFGDRSAIMAALTVIEIMEIDNVVDKMWVYGQRLKSYIMDAARTYSIPVVCDGNAVRFVVRFLDATGAEDFVAKSLFLQEMAKNGILMGVPTFSTASHRPIDLLNTYDALDDTFKVMHGAKGDYASLLEGDVIGKPIIRA